MNQSGRDLPPRAATVAGRRGADRHGARDRSRHSAARAGGRRTARATATPPSPLWHTVAKLEPRRLSPADVRFPINLATALRLSDARPLIVAAAQASVWVAEAELTQAKVLWIPDAQRASDYLRHDGGGPDFNKGILTAPSVNFFYGGAGL